MADWDGRARFIFLVLVSSLHTNNKSNDKQYCNDP